MSQADINSKSWWQQKRRPGYASPCPPTKHLQRVRENTINVFSERYMYQFKSFKTSGECLSDFLLPHTRVKSLVPSPPFSIFCTSIMSPSSLDTTIFGLPLPLSFLFPSSTFYSILCPLEMCPIQFSSIF